MKRLEKAWGYELWLTEDERYAMKVLCIYAGHRLSLHYHEYKDETWYIESGSGLAKIQGVEMPLAPGDYVRIKPNTVHTIKPIGDEDLIIVEASTHELDDSVRIIKGGRI